ncbi:gluconokinase [Cryptococcus neoformans Gb118]|nr:gluconokinase [Cryptococcus neoformans var. grubii MW-RSA36]OXL10229.1 gluconokinase [Cryptococcus neoformans var. grubii Gb118]
MIGGCSVPFPQLFTSAPTTNISLFFSNLCRNIHFHLFTVSTFSSTTRASPRPINTQATMSSKPQQELAVPSRLPDPVLIIVMGPASCGKSTVGQDVADHFHIPFVDGDSLHPKSNIAKMSSGTPLTDEDRLPWLALIRSTAERMCKEQSDEAGGKTRNEEDGGLGRTGVVIACSALKKWYRDILRGVVKADPPPAKDLHEALPDNAQHPATSSLKTYFVYCYGTPELLKQRIAARKGHFFSQTMLDSQLAVLEDPSGEEDVTVANIDGTKEEVGERAVSGMKKLLGIN